MLTILAGLEIKNGNSVASTIGTGLDWNGQAFPSFERLGENSFRMPTVCLKHDVDGLVYTIHHVPGSKPSQSTVQTATDIMRFIHTDTLDALAFVQASKREKRFVFHDPHGRFCVIVESSRNGYIYWHHPGRKAKAGKSGGRRCLEGSTGRYYRVSAYQRECPGCFDGGHMVPWFLN